MFFSLSAECEIQRKTWLKKGSRKSNLSIARLFNTYNKSILKQTGLSIHHYDERQQIGQNFGERLANAHQKIFDQGYEAIITVGNDCLELNRLDWENIIQNISAGRSVLGPSLRDGAYLIGLTKTAFNYIDFQILPWQTNQLYTALNEYIHENTQQYFELPRLRDINNGQDLWTITHGSTISVRLKINLLRLLAVTHCPLFIQSFPPTLFYWLKDNSLRAPPQNSLV
ncbi:DUF2064 domain-containing protein [Membranihabitans marinus]|uniref:DUF2064 domain-containing protein n=1 Tax=Membranihabitans marinus TaxID=1227546 RepID=UPI001F2E9AF2|nr:DUF2064 domain-containing protein [Membranihabitans marinus]